MDLVPLHRLQWVTDDPWRDLAEGRPKALAAAELRRLRLRSDSTGKPVDDVGSMA